MYTHDAINRLTLLFQQLRIDLQLVGNMDSLDNEDVPFLLNLSYRLGFEITFACWDTARLKGAAKRAGHSTTGRGYDVIKRRGMGLRYIGANPVVLRNL